MGNERVESSFKKGIGILKEFRVKLYCIWFQRLLEKANMTQLKIYREGKEGSANCFQNKSTVFTFEIYHLETGHYFLREKRLHANW